MMKCAKNHDMRVQEARHADNEGLPCTRRIYYCWRCDVSATTYEVPFLGQVPSRGGHNGRRAAAVLTYDQLMALQKLQRGIMKVRDQSNRPVKTKHRKMPGKLPCSAKKPCDDKLCGNCKTMTLPIEGVSE